nr:MAG TPA: baseplate assembly protein [Caudoviricetes sp.]
MQQAYDFGATLQFGTVSAVDDTRHAVRVQLPALEGMETDWLPVLTLGAGGNRFYALPDPGELAVCLLDARGEGGVCLGVIYNESDPAPESDRNIWCKKFSNGTVIRHDRSSGQLTVDTPGDVLVKAARQVKIQTPTTEITGDTNILGHLTYSAGMSASNAGGGVAASINGTADVRGDVLLNGVSLQKFVESHTHPGDSGGQTGTPQL